MRTLCCCLIAVVAACSSGSGDKGDGGGSDDAGMAVDGGDAGAAKLTVDGGTLSDLRFGVVGDTRPLMAGDTANYPSAVITQIYEDLAALSPAPQFVVSTGDYQYVDTGLSTTDSQSTTELSDYLAAAAHFPGTLFAGMGNHECTGYTNSECGPDGADGITGNYSNFLSMLLSPIGATTPYYSVPFKAADGSWTAKLVFTAANAWDGTQSSWLTQAMAQTTTYTFVVRHESTEDAKDLDSIAEIDSILNASTYTLLLVGHTHTFRHSSQFPRETIIGNGGVPGTSGDFGFGIVSRQSDGTILLQQYDEMSGAPTAGGVSFSVNAAGAIMP